MTDIGCICRATIYYGQVWVYIWKELMRLITFAVKKREPIVT